MDTAEKNRIRYRLRRIIKKDAKKCETCGSNYKIDIHHIDKDITNNSEDNLMFLCHRCHARLHRINRDVGLRSKLTRQMIYIIKNSRLSSIKLAQVLGISAIYIRFIRTNRRNPKVFENETNVSFNNEYILQELCGLTELHRDSFGECDNI